jgi:hypothetical protein
MTRARAWRESATNLANSCSSFVPVGETIDREASTRTKDKHEHEPWPG